MVVVPLVQWGVTKVTITVDGEDETMTLAQFEGKLMAIKRLPPEHSYWANKPIEFVEKMTRRAEALLAVKGMVETARAAFATLPAHLATIGGEQLRMRFEMNADGGENAQGRNENRTETDSGQDNLGHDIERLGGQPDL